LNKVEKKLSHDNQASITTISGYMDNNCCEQF
jgi:hypothetical protein